MTVSFRVFSRRGCHLCELLLEELEPLVRGAGRIEVCDIDERPEWQQRFATRIPVVCVGERVLCEYTLDKSAVHAVLRAGE